MVAGVEGRLDVDLSGPRIDFVGLGPMLQIVLSGQRFGEQNTCFVCRRRRYFKEDQNKVMRHESKLPPVDHNAPDVHTRVRTSTPAGEAGGRKLKCDASPLGTEIGTSLASVQAGEPSGLPYAVVAASLICRRYAKRKYEPQHAKAADKPLEPYISSCCICVHDAPE